MYIYGLPDMLHLAHFLLLSPKGYWTPESGRGKWCGKLVYAKTAEHFVFMSMLVVLIMSVIWFTDTGLFVITSQPVLLWDPRPKTTVIADLPCFLTFPLMMPLKAIALLEMRRQYTYRR